MSRVTSVSLYHFNKNLFWAFKQMGIAPRQFKLTPGLHFFKFLGTGGGEGFSLKPDFSTYALLSVWESQHHFEQQLEENSVYKMYKENSYKVRHLLLKPIKSHGSWDNQNPFETDKDLSLEDTSPLVIITRATLNWSKLLSFWKSVPKASKAISQAEGIQYYKGIGEWPFIQQATLSIWNNAAAVNQFAYRSKRHAEIVTKTRKQKWYKEDMFVRFQLIYDKKQKWK